jgi:hypothetical protein
MRFSNLNFSVSQRCISDYIECCINNIECFADGTRRSVEGKTKPPPMFLRFSQISRCGNGSLSARTVATADLSNGSAIDLKNDKTQERRCGRPCPVKREKEIPMPANFGEIASYHKREEARYLTLAQAARDRGSDGEAGYLAELARRCAQVAEEQRTAMRLEPDRLTGNRIPSRRPAEPNTEPKRTSLATVCLLAVLRGPGQIAAAIRQSISARNAPLIGLGLH